MMTIIIQRRNLFLFPLRGGKIIIWGHTCHWLILHNIPSESLWRAPCCLLRCVQEAEGLDKGVCDLWDVKNQHWPHSGFTIHADVASESSAWVCTVWQGNSSVQHRLCPPHCPRDSPDSKLGDLLWLGEDNSRCGVGLRNHQTLMWVLLPILSSSAICNSRHPFALWRQTFRNPAGWNVHITPTSSLLLCWFTLGLLIAATIHFFLIWKSQLLSKSRKYHWIFSGHLSLVEKNQCKW